MNLAKAHSTVAALWFAISGLVPLTLLFQPWRLAFRAVLVYVFLPTVAAAAAGGFWGGVILDRSKTSTLGQGLVRGVAIAAGAFVIFAALFAVVLPVFERGWSLRQSGGLFLLTSTLGILLAAPVVLFGGMLAGGTLYLFGRKTSTE